MRDTQLRGYYFRRRKLALVLPGHNEELILGATIDSAVAAGLSLNDIYVVDDDSSDDTRRIALSRLSPKNILTVARSGKARAVQQAIEKFEIIKRYCWVHIADADSIFSPNYFRIYRKHLDMRTHAAAVGFVQSMRGNWIATYRSFSYTYGQHIFRRIQSWFGMITVLPGPVTCFQTNIIPRLDFESGSLTEDFDLTLQIHRKRLGRIRFIPEAVNYTQDPRTIRDFYAQTLRWQRGFFQGLKTYRVGLHPRPIDVGIAYQMAESLFYLFQILIMIPLLLLTSASYSAVLLLLLGDYLAVTALAIFSAIAAKRPMILTTLAYFYILRFIELAGFVQSFVDIFVLRKFKKTPRGWQTEGRRYAVSAEDIQSIQ